MITKKILIGQQLFQFFALLYFFKVRMKDFLYLETTLKPVYEELLLTSIGHICSPQYELSKLQPLKKLTNLLET